MSSSRESTTLDLSNQNSDKKIFERLKKVSTENIADAFESLGLQGKAINFSSSGIKPINYTSSLCGRAFTVLFSDVNDPREAIGKNTRDYLNSVPEDSVIMISNTAGNDFSVWGGILSHYAQKHNIAGTITDGGARDIDDIKKHPYPVFSSGESCERSTGRYKVVALKSSITIAGVSISQGDYILANRSGIVIIEPIHLDKVISAAEKKQAEEKKIIKLINQGYSLFEIDDKMAEEKKTSENKSIEQTPRMF